MVITVSYPAHDAGKITGLFEGEKMRPNPYNAEKRRKELEKKKKKEEKKLRKTLGKENDTPDENDETAEDSGQNSHLTE